MKKIPFKACKKDIEYIQSIRNISFQNQIMFHRILGYNFRNINFQNAKTLFFNFNQRKPELHQGLQRCHIQLDIYNIYKYP